MIDLQWIRANTDLAKSRHNKRPNTSPEEIDQLIELDASRRSAQGKLDEAKTEANAAAQEVGKLFKSGQVEQAELLREKTKELKATISSLEQTEEANEALNAHWINFPTLPSTRSLRVKVKRIMKRSGDPIGPVKRRAHPIGILPNALIYCVWIWVLSLRAVDFLFM